VAYDIGPKIGIDGEAEFRSAINGINENLKTLGTEMKVVASQFDKGDNSVEALSSRNEVLNKQIDEQNKKLAELQKGLSSASDKYGENDKVTQGWQRSVNQATAELNTMERELKNNTDAMEKATNPADDLGKEIEEFGNKADEAGEKAFSMGDMIKANLISEAIIGGIKNLVGSISSLASEALEAADSIQQTADQTGLSAEKIQELAYVGDTVGTSIDTITGSFSKLINNMSSASGESGTAYEAFEKLGIKVTDSAGNLRDSNDVFNEAIDALGKVTNETERTAIAQDIFGKSAADLNPLIKAGSDELEKLAQQAKDTGAVMSNDTVSALDDFGDTMGQLKTSVTGIAGSILSELMPSIEPLIEKLQESAPAIAETVSNIASKVAELIGWLVDNGDKVIAVISGIAAGFVAWNVVTMIQGAVTAIKAFQLANEGAAIAQAALNVVMNANPIGIIITAIVGLVAVIGTLFATNEDLRNGVKEIWGNITEVVSGAIEKVKGFLSGVISFVKDNWQALLLMLVNPISGAFKLIYDNNEEFRTKVNELVEKVKTFFVDLGKSIGELPGKLKEHFDNGVQKIQDFANSLKDKAIEAAKNVLTKIVDGLSELPDNLKTIGINAVKGIWLGMNGLVTWIQKNVKEFGSNIISGLSSGLTGLADIGLNLVKGLWNGINNATDWIISKIKGFGGSVLNGIKDFFGIHSPSTVFRDEVGKYLAQGLGEGFVDEMDSVAKDINASIPTDFDIESSFDMSSKNSGAPINGSQDILSALIGTFGVEITATEKNGGLFEFIRLEAKKYYQRTGTAPFPIG
jgi:methyl-accepting chemotaxis protein